MVILTLKGIAHVTRESKEEKHLIDHKNGEESPTSASENQQQ